MGTADKLCFLTGSQWSRLAMDVVVILRLTDWNEVWQILLEEMVLFSF